MAIHHPISDEQAQAARSLDPYEGVRRLAERVERKQDWFNALVKQAKGGNPNKLVSERDLHKHAFAAICASAKRED